MGYNPEPNDRDGRHAFPWEFVVFPIIILVGIWYAIGIRQCAPKKIPARYALYLKGDIQTYYTDHGEYPSEIDDIFIECALHRSIESLKSHTAIFYNGKLIIPAKFPPPKGSMPYELPEEVVAYYGPGGKDFYWLAEVGNNDDDPMIYINVFIPDERQGFDQLYIDDEFEEYGKSGAKETRPEGPTARMRAITKFYKLTKEKDFDVAFAYATETGYNGYIGEMEKEVAQRLNLHRNPEFTTQYYIKMIRIYHDKASFTEALDRLVIIGGDEVVEALKDCIFERVGKWEEFTYRSLLGSTLGYKPEHIDYNIQTIPMYRDFEEQVPDGYRVPLQSKTPLITALVKLDKGDLSYLEPVIANGLDKLIGEELLYKAHKTVGRRLHVKDVNYYNVESAFKEAHAYPIYFEEIVELFGLLEEINQPWSRRLTKKYSPYFCVKSPCMVVP